jgi:bile acid:Na+ symporter, BASS family
MFEFFRSLVPIIAPVFVISMMLHVGLTQKPSEIIEYLKERSFVLKMLLANFVLAPLLMILILRFTSFDPALEAGLLVFALCAGAPFLIKLTQTAQHSIALGAAVMMLLMVVTIVYVPLALPLFLSGLSVDAWAVANSLLLQMLVPVIAGMLVVRYLPLLTKTAQPLAGWSSNILLYVLTGATLIGYSPNMFGIMRTGALFVGLAFVVGAFGIGYLMGEGKDHLEDVGGLGTAQRNTGAAVIIAIQNFSDPDELVIITLTNTLGVVLLLFIAKRLSRDHKVRIETV